MTKIRKVLITAFGDESKLAIVEDQIAPPSAKEVQLAVEYSIVSGSDVNMRRGIYPFQRKAPLTPGYSVLGTVAANGKGATRIQPGECVVCLSKYDGQAERINLPERFLVPVPDGIDRQAAVALPLDWVTAYQMVHRSARLKPGQAVFIHGLSGAVGGALLQLAVLQGAKAFGTANKAKHEELRKLGAIPFDYANTSWTADMQAGGGVDAVFDPLGYESFDQSYSILRRGGILVAYGLNLPVLKKTPRGHPLPVILKLFARNLAFWSRKRTTFYGLRRNSRHYLADLALLLDWLARGVISVPIKAVFPMDQIQAAHREYASSAGMGSIVLRVAAAPQTE